MARLLTRKRFEQWLRGREGLDVVGLRRETGECPLACYLRDQGFIYPTVTDHSYEAFDTVDWPRNAIEGKLPAWARRLVDLVDAGGSKSTVVTARDVRRYLRSKVE